MLAYSILGWPMNARVLATGGRVTEFLRRVIGIVPIGMCVVVCSIWSSVKND